MIRYTPSNQLSLELFKHPFEHTLDQDNRWVKLATLVPWDSLANIYAKSLSFDSGRLSVDIRIVIGALIIKHKMTLTDRDTVALISENVYMQYFCGLKGFQSKQPFDASLFVDIRKRLGNEKFDAFNAEIIRKYQEVESGKRHKKQNKEGDRETERGLQSETGKETPNKGTLKIDASVADQYITYPTDLKLLNTCRQESERLIDALFQRGNYTKKPRTYRRKARSEYLGLSKKKNKDTRLIHKSIGKQLRYLKRNVSSIHTMLDNFEVTRFPLQKRDQKIFWVMQHILNQQQEMHTQQKHTCEHRIVNLYQPYVRPILRGKDKAKVEFGAKINISEVDGMVRLDHFSWENFNEGGDVDLQLERYHEMYGCYPELLLADRIFLTRENRHKLKEKQIRIVGKPLGRPPKEELNAYQKRKLKKERNQRNHVEAKFGQAKNGYRLNQIRARRSDTSKSWISAILFIMNLEKLFKVAKKQVAFIFYFVFIVIHKLQNRKFDQIKPKNLNLEYYNG
jgi:transposase, IS5 family